MPVHSHQPTLETPNPDLRDQLFHLVKDFLPGFNVQKAGPESNWAHQGDWDSAGTYSPEIFHFAKQMAEAIKINHVNAITAQAAIDPTAIEWIFVCFEVTPPDAAGSWDHGTVTGYYSLLFV